jgi:methionine synthase II (cobalamin-independent)
VTPGPLTFPPGTATGVGSLPGDDPVEAARTVFGELPELPHVPELPARGPGADLVGRTAGTLVDLHVDLQPSGWRFVDRPSKDERRAASYLAQDLDAVEEVAQDYRGLLKVQLAGPWTLAATIELSHGDKALSDPGACRDLAASLAEAVSEHVADVRRRVPGAEVVVQLDEPSLPMVLAGRVRTASGFGALRAIEGPVAEAALRQLVDVVGAAGARAVVHCCAADVPLPLLHRAGVHGVSLDVSLLSSRADDALGEAVEDGVALLLGVVATSATEQGPSLNGAAASAAQTAVRPVKALWRRLGLSPALLRTAVAVTPTCGLAGSSPAGARRALTTAAEAARILADDPEA